MAEPSAQAREVVRTAARWLALLESGKASEGELQRLAQWRASNTLHEQAWQKAQLLRQRFAQLPGELALATLDRPDAERRALLKQALGVAALVPAAWLLGRQVPLDAWTADVHTAVGARSRRVLGDGTVLQLNTDSAVNIDLAARRLTLVRGEVAIKTPQGVRMTVQVPFGQVAVNAGEACARLFDQSCRVSVLNGTATLQPLRGTAVALQAGQQASLQAASVSVVSELDDWLLGWRDGVLRLDDRPLGDLLRELRRYRPGVLRWAAALDTLRVTGTFHLDDTDRALSLLAASLPLEVHARTRYWVTLTAREKRA
ncbi:FecR domain-containing protein [Pseudomonas sp. NPDC089743]|uniref:FecR domain-containing protein n=1 Tax=Pseudomonas sp. NPDC089743 TaxID=3364471 RepID=UPI0038262BE8